MLETRLQELHDAISEFSSDLVNYRGRVSPYHNNYLYNHLESLQHRFPATLAFLGEENFRFFGRSFLMEHPPMTANIDLFGEDFPHFLSRSSQLREYPFLKDLAQIDSLYTMQERDVIVGKGTLALWQELALGHEQEEIELSPNELCKVRLLTEGEDIYMVEDSAGDLKQ